MPKVHTMRLVLQVKTDDDRQYEGSTRDVWLGICDYEDMRVFKVLDAVASMGATANPDVAASLAASLDLTDEDIVSGLFTRLEKLVVPTEGQLVRRDRGLDGTAPTTVLELLRNRLLCAVVEGRSVPDPEAKERRAHALDLSLKLSTSLLGQADDTEVLRDG